MNANQLDQMMNSISREWSSSLRPMNRIDDIYSKLRTIDKLAIYSNIVQQRGMTMIPGPGYDSTQEFNVDYSSLNSSTYKNFFITRIWENHQEVYYKKNKQIKLMFSDHKLCLV